MGNTVYKQKSKETRETKKTREREKAENIEQLLYCCGFTEGFKECRVEEVKRFERILCQHSFLAEMDVTFAT